MCSQHNRNHNFKFLHIYCCHSCFSFPPHKAKKCEKRRGSMLRDDFSRALRRSGIQSPTPALNLSDLSPRSLSTKPVGVKFHPQPQDVPSGTVKSPRPVFPTSPRRLGPDDKKTPGPLDYSPDKPFPRRTPSFSFSKSKRGVIEDQRYPHPFHI
jgi:hypothetical protein